MDVAEVVCGDPSCAPVDTVFTLVWQSGGKGVFALPLTAAEVTKDDLIDSFPVRLIAGLCLWMMHQVDCWCDHDAG